MAVSAEALISLQEVKDFLGITSTSEDALLEILVDAASQAIEGYLRGTWVVQRSTAEEYERPQGNRVFLRHRPIVSVTSIADPSGQTIPATDYEIHNAQGFLMLTNAWQIPRGTSSQRSFYTITYVAGMVTVTANVARRFKQACQMFVASLRSRGKSSGVIERSVGDLSVRYAEPVSLESSFGIPPEVTALVSQDVMRWV